MQPATEAIKPDRIIPKTDKKQKPQKGLVTLREPDEKLMAEALKMRKPALIKKIEDADKMVMPGPDDREAYDKLVETRKYLKALKVQIGKFCETARAPSVKVQDQWVEIEKEWKAIIAPTEAKLLSMEKDWDTKYKDAFNQKKKEQDKRFTGRIADLTSKGAKPDGDNMVLGDVSYSTEIIRDLDDETYGEVLVKYEAIYQAAEEVKRQNDEVVKNAKLMRDKLFNLRFKQLVDPKAEAEGYTVFSGTYTRDQLIDMEDEAFDKLKDSHNLQVADARAAIEAEKLKTETIINRVNDLIGLGFTLGVNGKLRLEVDKEHVFAEYKDKLNEKNEEQWAALLKVIGEAVYLKQVEEKRLANIEQARQTLAMSRSQLLAGYNFKKPVTELLDISAEAWAALLHEKKTAFDTAAAQKLEKERLEKEKKEKEREAEELLNASDGVKWKHFTEQLAKIEVPVLTSKKYKLVAENAGKAIKAIIFSFKPTRNRS